MPGDLPRRLRVVDPCTAESAERTRAERKAEIESLDPAEAALVRSREAMELLLIFVDTVGYIGVQEFLDFIEANGVPELRRRLANMAAMAGRRS